MKRLATFLTMILLFGNTVFAQDGKNIYNKYSDGENVNAVYISSAMFRLIKHLPDMKISNDEINLTSIVQSLDGLYIINSKNGSTSENLHRDVEKFVSSGKYELLMEAKEKDEIVRIYTSVKDDIITSFVLLADEPGECNFICFDGRISREQLEQMIAKEN